MATTVTSADMTVTLTETVTLAGVKRGKTSSVTVEGVEQISQRVITVTATDPAGDAPTAKWTLLQFTAAGNEAAVFKTSEFKYARITNLDSTTTVRIRTTAASGQQWRELGPGESMSFFNTKLLHTASPTSNATYEDMTLVYAQAVADVDLEVFLASA